MDIGFKTHCNCRDKKWKCPSAVFRILQCDSIQNSQEAIENTCCQMGSQAGLSRFWRTDKIISLWPEFVQRQNKLQLLWLQNSCSRFNFPPTKGFIWTTLVSCLSIGEKDSFTKSFYLEKSLEDLFFSCQCTKGRLEIKLH